MLAARPPVALPVLLLILAPAVLGCGMGVIGDSSGSAPPMTGSVGGSGSGGGGGGSGGAGGNRPGPPEPVRVGAGDMRRLSPSEYEGTLRLLVGDEFFDRQPALLAGLPSDRGAEHFESLGGRVPTAGHVDAYDAIAERLAAFLTEDPRRLARVAACLPAGKPDRACVQSAITSFGRRLFRRPISDAEKAWLLAVYDDGATLSDADGLQVLLFSMFQAPAFLYRPELDGPPAAGVEGAFALSGYEVATRLSFLIWGTGPDEPLLNAAGTGALGGEAGLRAQATRLFADPRAATQVGRFFAEWLGARDLAQPAQSDAFLAGLDRRTLSADLRTDLVSFVRHQVFARGGSYQDLITSTEGLPPAGLAALYGTNAPGDGQRPVNLGGHYPGLLTRAALLFDAGEITSPVHRGVRVLEAMLCRSIPGPNPQDFPPNSIVPPPFDPKLGARARWTQKTGQGVCGGCHNLINPFGFVFEHYDTLGRHRADEPVVDPDSGKVVNRLPIDDVVTLDLGQGDVRVAGAAGLSQALAQSPEALECFARQWFRFASGRRELADDAQVIAALRAAGPKAALEDLLGSLALTPQFRLRKPGAP
jgi:hypothetical protein